MMTTTRVPTRLDVLIDQGGMPHGVHIEMGDHDGDGDGVRLDYTLDEYVHVLKTLGQLGLELDARLRDVDELGDIAPACYTPADRAALVHRIVRDVARSVEELLNP